MKKKSQHKQQDNYQHKFIVKSKFVQELCEGKQEEETERILVEIAESFPEFNDKNHI